MTWISEYFGFFAMFSFSQPHWGMELFAHLFWPVFCISVLINVVIWLRDALSDPQEARSYDQSSNLVEEADAEDWNFTPDGFLRMTSTAGGPINENSGLDMAGNTIFDD